jgi:alpha/beta superfamily hydrolase
MHENMIEIGVFSFGRGCAAQVAAIVAAKRWFISRLLEVGQLKRRFETFIHLFWMQASEAHACMVDQDGAAVDGR